MTVASTFTIFALRLATCFAASSRKIRLGTPFQRGSVLGEKVADVRLAERAEERVANGMHERIGVRMSVEALRVRNLDAAEDELAPRDQRVNVVADANVNHDAV